ncbi:MAG: DUF1653 domain-containing protein [Rickettsiales bacterium]|nr:MAG: DUF1653 domain-containing protein [Rickettsiales bacterium]
MYYHYRDKNNFYKVVNIALDEASESPLIIYKALYGQRLTWCRPLNKWFDFVDNNGVNETRFTKK